MRTCPTKHALAITNGLYFALDRLDDTAAKEIKNIVDFAVDHPTGCNIEFFEATKLVAERLIECNPWLNLARFPKKHLRRPGYLSAWIDAQEARHGAECTVGIVRPGLFEPHDHNPMPSNLAPGDVMVNTPYGMVPLSELPPEAQRSIRRQLGLDDE